MPDGFEKAINIQEMADLLRFLKDWRHIWTAASRPRNRQNDASEAIRRESDPMGSDPFSDILKEG